MNTIVLLNPPIFDFAAYDLFSKPLGLLYLATALRQRGYRVRLVDALDRHHPAAVAAYGPPHERANGTGKFHHVLLDPPACLHGVRRRYRRYGMEDDLLRALLIEAAGDRPPVAVLVGSMMTYWYPGVQRAIALVRQLWPGTPVALGGIYASLMPEHARRVCRPDRVFAGGALGPLWDWLTALARPPAALGAGDDWADGPGPAYDLYRQLRYATLMTSLGCPFRCGYCAAGVLQPRWRRRSPAAVLGDLETVLDLLPADRGRYDIALMDDALLAGAEDHLAVILAATARWSLPLRFHCPNGLHVRFVGDRVAELMAANHFEMVRLSYEAAGPDSAGQRASDRKVSDVAFARAVDCLTRAGYRPAQLDAYVLVGLPGQDLAEMRRSVRAVQDRGVRVRLCQYTPIPRTALFAEACRVRGLDPNEPLLHNNSLLPALDPAIGADRFQAFKEEVKGHNATLGSAVEEEKD